MNSMRKKSDLELSQRRLMNQKSIDKLLSQERKQQSRNTDGSEKEVISMKSLTRVSMFTLLSIVKDMSSLKESIVGIILMKKAKSTSSASSQRENG